TGTGELLSVLGWSLVFVFVMFGIVRPIMRWTVQRWGDRMHLGQEVFALTLAGLLLSAWATHIIGIHAIFGAFVFGVIIPKEAAGLVAQAIERIESVTVLMLLPIFFIVTGLDVNIRNLGSSGLFALAIIMVAAVAGKFIGAAAA